MRIFILAIIVLLNFILQTTLMHYIAIGQIIPNTALVIIICYALIRNDIEGAIFGFFVGLLNDIFFGHIVGVTSLLMLTTGYFSGKVFKDFYKENYIVSFILVATASLIYEFMFYMVNFLLIGRTNFLRYFAHIILPTAAYNLVVCIFIYKIIYSINNKLEKRYNKKIGFMNKKRDI